MRHRLCSNLHASDSASECSSASGNADSADGLDLSSVASGSLHSPSSSLSTSGESFLSSLPHSSSLSSEKEHVQILSQQEAMIGAFYSATFNAPQGITPQEWLRLGKRDEPFAVIFHDQRFLQAWGYASKDELGKVIGCVDGTGMPNEEEREFYKPLRQLAFHGKIDKAQFCKLKKDYRFKNYLNLFHIDALTVDQLWKIAELYCDTSKESEEWRNTSLTGVLAAYARGAMTLEELKRFFASITGGCRYAEIVPELFESGALPKEWKAYEDILKRSLNVLDGALGGFIDPIVCDFCFAIGDSWDRELACNYFGVKDLSQIQVTEVDYQRANHSGIAAYGSHYVGGCVTQTLRGNGGASLLLATEVRRRLVRERAASSKANSNAGGKVIGLFNNKIKAPCVLY